MLGGDLFIMSIWAFLGNTMQQNEVCDGRLPCLKLSKNAPPNASIPNQYAMP